LAGKDLVDNITISYGPKVLDEERKTALGFLGRNTSHVRPREVRRRFDILICKYTSR